MEVRCAQWTAFHTCSRFLGARAGKVELVALLQGCKKFPGCNAQSGSEGESSRSRERDLSPRLRGIPYSPFQPPGTPCPEQCLHCSLRRTGTPPLAARGRLVLPLSPAARAVVTPLSESAARGGAGKWLRAATLRSSSAASSPWCCSGGRRRGESTSDAQGGSYGARGRRALCKAGRALGVMRRRS
ncbi:hypothetical protein NN561_006486 [Cricetulus griseus]